MTPKPNAKPHLSIVIASWNGMAYLRECLTSLCGQFEAAQVEVIVATNFDGGAAGMLAKEFPGVKHLALSATATVPVLRSAGIAEATGEIIALAEDHCTFDENWSAEIRKAHELPYAVIGGAVENASRQRALDWAMFFFDYGRYMPPNTAGLVNALSGNNVSYKGAALGEVRECFRDGFFETFVHGELARRGHKLYLAPSVIVHHRKTYKFRSAFVQCYHLARSFAARRVPRVALGKRLLFGLSSLVLPVLLPARIAVRTLRKRRHFKELVWAFPLLVLLMASWSFGEFCGYLFGEGASEDKWK